MKRALGWRLWFAPTTALKLPRPICRFAAPANFLARGNPARWDFTSPIRCVTANFWRPRAGKHSLWPKTLNGESNFGKRCRPCRRSGSGAITWRGLDDGTSLIMRIIAGTFRSRQLKSPKKLKIRPTSDMLRETLFNILGPRVEGSRFLDLFAGTGAVGIEAIRRGAGFALFVENHSAALRLIRENLAALEIQSQARIINSPAGTAIAKLQAERP